jgi:GNAT superfamily N-acetyltransferase
MRLELTEESPTTLPDYGRVPCAFVVHTLLRCTVRRHGLGGFGLEERPAAEPYVKDYDAVEAERPARWADQFDVARWGVLAAWLDGERAGGAVVAVDTPHIARADGRPDVAVLWDLRVAPAARGRGSGSALFEAAATWAARRGYRQLGVETQNVNLPACRLYARHGCVLGAIDRHAYPSLPDEIQLRWYRTLETVPAT